ncbi:uncharacterized protein LOC114457963 isoform X2 [Gouania willdenowi]|uniref:uncharacterized protein LOC114457963 isoform X2 n=1 Tax=Gouania willdenowi TaxID=441366 RepID=UPI001055A1F2|nr:uncharacterized protein LOC114457963 isoform X2 [Gouania willdenowi]
MRRHATDVQEPVHEAVPSPPLPTDHVLSSGAVLFPGAYDQHGYPLVVFPVDGQTKLSTQLSKAEVVDFISYFHWLHIKKQEKQGLVSVVADLRQASPPTIRFIAETLLLLELHKRTVHSVYIVQPMKKDAVKLIHKVFSPAKAYTTSFKKVLLKEIPELSNYIDRSQLPSSLGGYLMYCHQSWVVFIKDIEAFVREFQSVVQRLPSCISTLQAITQTPLPSTFTELQHFCSTNEAQFLQLRRELGLDELLRHCESILDKLRYPDKESCYQAMAGTTLFTHTALDMLHNHSRITAAVQKVELLWQQAFSKAHLQLQVLHLREKAMQITENIETFLQQKLQPYKMEIARDAAKAGVLASDFEASMYNPAMALVCCAEDVTHTMAELFPFDRHTKEVWVLNLERLKDKMHSTVDFILQTLKAVTNYHQIYFKTSTWYSLILHENFLQELLSGLHCDAAHAQPQSGAIPAWRWRCSSFLRRNPPPYMEELLHLARVSELIPDDELKAAAKQMSQRCMTLRKLLISSGPVVVGHLQLALQWQYELLMDTHAGRSVIDIQTKASGSSLSKVEGIEEESHPIRHSPMNAGPELASAEVKPPSVSSRQDAYSGREGGKGLDSLRPALNQHQVQEQIISVSDSEHHGEECDLGSVGNSSRASLQIRPEVKPDSVNLEIKVKRTAALPTNPWLSLPVDDLENSYTITIRQNPMQLREESQWHDLPEPQAAVSQFNRSRDTQTEVLSCTEHPENYGWMLHSQSDVEEAEQSPFSKILSSTITDGREQSMCSMEEMPTLLWDSYDLHEQDSDAVDGTTDISLEDWDVKEQAGLREVEKMLITTNEILERPSSELAEAAVPGIDDCIDPGEADGPSDCGAKALDKNHLGAENAAMVGEKSFNCGLDLLTELKRVQILDEMIMEENIKIQELRFSEEKLTGKLLASQLAEDVLNVVTQKGSLRLQLEEDRKELDGDKASEAALIEKSKLEEKCDQVWFYDQTIGSNGRPCRLSFLEQRDRSDIPEPESVDTLTCLAVNREATSQTSSHCQVPNGFEIVLQTEHSTLNHSFEGEGQPQQTISQRELNMFGKNETFESMCDLNSTQHLDQSFSNKQSPSSFDVNQCISATTKPTSACNERNIPEDGVLLQQRMSLHLKLETSLSSEIRSEDGAFDPPKAKPIKAVVCVNGSYTPLENSHSTQSDAKELQVKPLQLLPVGETSKMSQDPVCTPCRKVNSNNNNNNHAPPETEDMHAFKTEEDKSMVETKLKIPEKPEVSCPADLSRHQPSVHSPPDQEFDPGGRDKLVHEPHKRSTASNAVRILHSESPVGQYQENGNTREMTHFKTPIVLDTGSGLMKAGFADQDLPSVLLPTIIGLPKYEEMINGHYERELYLGHNAQHMRGVLTLKHPIQNGIIRNWDEMEKIWQHTFQQLCVDPEDHPVLLTEAAMNSMENRQRMVQVMFESFNVPLTYVAMQAVLALYAAGRTTGVVFDSGDGVSYSVPVFEGYSLPHAVQRFPMAGVDVTMHLKKLLQEQGVSMRTTAEQEIVREMKEKCCYVALDYQEELKGGTSSSRETHYTMPDGQIVTLGTERFRAPEILFKPELIGRDHYGLHVGIFKSILGSDIDLRRCFLGNLVLSGGNTLLPGLPERLQAEIRSLLPADMASAVKVSSPTNRDFSVWCGGAVLASLSGFSSAWISQEEYEEYGPQIVFRKCF